MKTIRLAIAALLVTTPLAGCGLFRSSPSRSTPIKPNAAANVPVTPPGSTASTAADTSGELLKSVDDLEGYGAEQYRIVSKPDEVVAVLKNGATVICKRVVSPAVSVRAYARTGGAFEGRWLGGGLSHLLEHLVAGGSNEKRTEEQNRDLLQKIGNDSNAYTTSEHTSYFVNTTAENLEPAVDLVCNWVLGAKITDSEYRREYLVVQRELEMGKGEPDRVLYYLASANRYIASPARVPVIGYQEVIQGLSRDDVYAYYKLAYVPNNLIFSIAGDVDPEAMLAAVKRQVKNAKPGREFDRDIPPEPPVVAPRTVVATFPKLGEARVQLAFPTIRLADADLYALDLLATVLAGGESAVLVEQLRDQKQLVSSVTTVSDTPSYVEGSFQVELQLDPEKLKEATDATLALLEKVAADGVDARRLARAKVQMRTNRLRFLQTAEDVASELAQNFLSTGDIHFNDRYIERIEQVTPEQVKAVAAKYFDRQKLLTTALLPAEYTGSAGLPKAESLLRSMSSAAIRPAARQSDLVKRSLGPDTTLLVRRLPGAPLVSIQTYALGGVSVEDVDSNGLGNLAMQMVSRGTATRSPAQIAEFWDSIGGDFEAVSGNNTWSWAATCLPGDFTRAFEVFSDIVHAPSFPEAELKLVKPRVIAAIEGQDADWATQALRFFRKTYFGPSGSPYQFVAAGTRQNVEKFDIAAVRDWYARRVLPAKRVVAVFGDVDPAEAEALARKHFARESAALSNQPATRPVVNELKAPQPAFDDVPTVAVDQVAVNKTEQELAGVVIGFKADTVLGEPATFPLAIGDTMASGYTYPTGWIFETLRGRGLSYVAHAQNSPGRSPTLPGAFVVYAGCEPQNVNEVIDVMIENIARLQGAPQDWNATWFQRSKDLVVVAEALETQTPAQQASQAAMDELYGMGLMWRKSFADNIRRVTPEEIRKIAQNRLSHCVVTVSTPRPDLVRATSGIRRFQRFAPVELTPRTTQHNSSGPGR
jgi:zinc protease